MWMRFWLGVSAKQLARVVAAAVAAVYAFPLGGMGFLKTNEGVRWAGLGIRCNYLVAYIL